MRREVFTPRELCRQTIYPRGTIPGEYTYSNYAPGFAGFLTGSQVTPWRDIFSAYVRPSVSLPDDNFYGEVVSEIATMGFSFASLWQ